MDFFALAQKTLPVYNECTMRSTRAVVYKNNLIHNLSVVKSFIKSDVKICAAVKANGYGSGAVFAAKTALSFGASFCAVATVDEGIELRESGIVSPILLLSLCAPGEMKDAVSYKLTPLVCDEVYAELFNEAGGKYAAGKFPVHLAVDTGMRRIGCSVDEASFLAKRIVNFPHLALGGVCTHFSSADETDDEARRYTDDQFSEFMRAVKSIEAESIDPGIRHCAASAALLDRPEMQLDMVRPGIVMYGYFDGSIDEAYFTARGKPCELEPVTALESEVVAIKSIKKGEAVSYNRTWTAECDTVLATLPIGYADGLPRSLSPGLCVAINGKNYPVVGRICMDQCMVDVGSGSVHRWDKAVIFGPKNSGALQTARDIAKASGTIPYEILTGISKRVPRVEA